MPTFLPDGRHFVYMRISPSATAAERHLRRHARRQARLAEPSDADAVRSGRDVHPWRWRYGPAALRPAGDADGPAIRRGAAGARRRPEPVAQRVGSFRDSGSFGVSHNGVLVYRIEDDTQVSWIDREGRVDGPRLGRRPVPHGGPVAGRHASRRVADHSGRCDESRLVAVRPHAAGGGKRLTARRGLAEMPTWSRDGSHVGDAFDHSTIRDVPVNGADTDAELLRTNSQSGLWPGDWSPDGRFLLYTEYVVHADTGSPDLPARSSATSTSVPLVHTRFN